MTNSRVPIESLCEVVTSGGTPSRAEPAFWEGGSIPWFKTGELDDGVLGEPEERITQEALLRSPAKLFPENTVLMAMYGDGKTITTLGILGAPAATNQACCAMIADPQKCDFRYLFHALRFRRRELLKLVVAGAQRNLSVGIIKKFTIDWYPLPVQKRVATVLSAYDDLIENNRRRMVLLEQAVRQLYHEWFVRLRFPGHEHIRIVNGVPAGWCAMRASDALDINPRTALAEAYEHTFVEMSDLVQDLLMVQGTSKRSGRTGSKFRNGDTLFARITPCLENGKTAFVNFLGEDEVGRGSTEFIVLRSKRTTPEAVYCLARTYPFRAHAIKSMVGASGRQRVQESCFDKLIVLVPSDGILAIFTEIVRPMFAEVRTLDLQNHKLRAARDLLLPRLMSGEIAV